MPAAQEGAPDPDDQWVGDDRFAHVIADQLEQPEVREAPDYDPEEEDETPVSKRNKNWRNGVDRRMQLLSHISQGVTVKEACEKVGIQHQTYKGYRKRFQRWAHVIDEAREYAIHHKDSGSRYTGTPASFMNTYFGMPPTWFQLMFLDELAKTPKGNILMVLWPPEHGKTTTFENYANMVLAQDASWRSLVASENQGIARKILGRIQHRMNPMGPYPAYVAKFGPFVPQVGGGIAEIRQPWTDTKFSIYKKRASDERNYSMEAVGVGGSIVSARTDHLHVDDPQSTRTLGQTDKITNWFRQDALSRPAENGITSVCGTRVGEFDFFEDLLSDGGLDDIMKVIRFPAIITDNDTGEQKPLWQKPNFPGTDEPDPDASGHTLESLDRMRRKVGDEIWDRNWMQNPGASRKGKGTFTVDMVEKCNDMDVSLENHPGMYHDGRDKPIVYIGLDPALGSKNCIIAVMPTPKGKLQIVRIREDIGFERNEQIMGALESVVRWCNMDGMVTDVIIEDKNFQLGLKNDERMMEMSEKHGFNIRGHLTGWNKYDPDIGVASMTTSFIKGEVVLPHAADSLTDHEMGEFKRQLYAWKPGARGNKLRQDRVMAFWFVWMLWRSRHKSLEGVGNHQNTQWTRQNRTDWMVNEQGLMVPLGAA